jgi:hypothetical protein
MQLALQRENERRLDEVNVIIHALWATVPSESQKTFIEATMNTAKSIFKSLFPFANQTPKSTVDRDQEQARLLKKLIDGKGFKIEIEGDK